MNVVSFSSAEPTSSHEEEKEGSLRGSEVNDDEDDERRSDIELNSENCKKNNSFIKLHISKNWIETADFGKTSCIFSQRKRLS